MRPAQTADLTEDKQANCGEGQSAKTQRTNPARHRDISTEQQQQQQQQEKGEARQLWPTVGGTRRGCAACLFCAQIAAWVRARACVARPCKSQPCDVILVTQEMRVRETVVSLYAHRRHSRKEERSRMGKRRCDAAALPPACPGGCCSAIFKHMPPVSRVVEEEEEAHENGIWGASHRRDGVRHACRGREGAVWCRVGEV